MKKSSIFIIFYILLSLSAISQTADDIVCIFKKNQDEKVFTTNKDGTRFAHFIIQGIKSDEQAANIRDNIKANDFIIEFTISEEKNMNERDAYILIQADTKIVDKYDILIANGINYIKIDDKTINVKNYKARMDRQRAKMNAPKYKKNY